MFEYETSGKNINDAIENGLSVLKITREDVDIKIIQNAGLFKKAKVLLVVSDEIADNNEAIKNIKKLQKIEDEILKENEKLEQAENEKDAIIGEIATNILSVDKQSVTPEQHIEIAKNFVLGLVKTAGYTANVTTTETENDLKIDINGENLGKLIGHNGENLTSMQYLTNIYLGRYSRKTKRVILDINGFKAKRKEVLESLAHRLAKRVQETQKPATLEPMNSYERLIVHNVIALYPDLKSHSEGNPPKRHLIIEII